MIQRYVYVKSFSHFTLLKWLFNISAVSNNKSANIPSSKPTFLEVVVLAIMMRNKAGACLLYDLRIFFPETKISSDLGIRSSHPMNSMQIDFI